MQEDVRGCNADQLIAIALGRKVNGAWHGLALPDASPEGGSILLVSGFAQAFMRLRLLVLLVAVGIAIGGVGSAVAQPRVSAEDVVLNWYRMVLELVRHTPTYSPPAASRTFAYLGVTTYEAAASGEPQLRSLAGQLNDLTTLPARQHGLAYDEAVIQHAALSLAVQHFFFNTGPTGQRAMQAMDAGVGRMVATGLDMDTFERSQAYGRAVAQHVIAWSMDDGGATIENLGFPLEHKLQDGPEHWKPTSSIRLQQFPLLPDWGSNRTFAMPDGATCPVPEYIAYSEEPGSGFYNEVREVYDAVRNISAEERAIALFWADDAMLSPTPPGHWISIAMQILQAEEADLAKSVDVLARVGIAVGDAFIGCWNAKYVHDLVRPITYIHRSIDPTWQTVLITPPFPEYPSGHSTQSGAASAVFEAIYGENYEFVDDTHGEDGLPARSFTSFQHAAQEAAISRLYGGIHYRMAIEAGLAQGECIAAYVNALETRR